ncbi:MAG: 50S ribosomal protein L10 [Candidatus Hydrogenedentes bacterium]|nr:50S ribosomal protein L10 [Candidatus Hydrogenedentota bacterium]
MNKLPTPEKIKTVQEIKDRLKSNLIVVMTQFKGINVAQDTELRKRLRQAGVQYKVYKNTLGRIALREIGAEKAADLMDGPTAWAFSNDPVLPAKILREFSKEVPVVQIVGGVLEGKPLTKEQVLSLANLPPKEVLQSQVIGAILGPLRNLVNTLSAVPRNLVTVLNEIRKKKEEQSTA